MKNQPSPAYLTSKKKQESGNESIASQKKPADVKESSGGIGKKEAVSAVGSRIMQSESFSGKSAGTGSSGMSPRKRGARKAKSRIAVNLGQTEEKKNEEEM